MLIIDSNKVILINKLRFAMCVHLQPLPSASKQYMYDGRETWLSVCISSVPTGSI